VNVFVCFLAAAHHFEKFPLISSLQSPSQSVRFCQLCYQFRSALLPVLLSVFYTRKKHHSSSWLRYSGNIQHLLAVMMTIKYDDDGDNKRGKGERNEVERGFFLVTGFIIITITTSCNGCSSEYPLVQVHVSLSIIIFCLCVCIVADDGGRSQIKKRIQHGWEKTSEGHQRDIRGTSRDIRRTSRDIKGKPKGDRKNTLCVFVYLRWR